ncbi:Alpha-N-acetylgalactosaminidase [Rubripirellula obstinata]|uniref:Alpha-N-acetylgalactosaminidase n=1 Tax=Rubripirellula obstinata TaxID=406547 RepID=A0A5B1CH99_9BACT|nr:Gfo/Idh/MocA family oxidoreductase [Rubripirellula obstinata]KAA1258893.1 Alpha-N-acetylgalactosaminidase [Rubripirellula obstinata]
MSEHRQPSRRHFLKSVAATGAVLPLGSQVMGSEKAGQPLANDRLVVATIGLRNQGKLITNQARQHAEIAAFADVDSRVLGENVEITAEQQGKKPDGYKDYRKILDRQDIDAVLIGAPDHWHTKIAVEAMLSGKDVYCEKPLTLTIDEGKLIEKVVDQTGRVFQVGTMQRSDCDQRFLQAVAMVKQGRIGKVKKITCGIDGMGGSPVIPITDVPTGLDWDFWLGPAPKTDYRALPKMREGYGGGVPLFSNCHYAFRNWHAYAGGKMTDWGAHHVDIACWAIGASDPNQRDNGNIKGASKITPLDFTLPVEHKDGFPVVEDQYNEATSFTIQVDMPDGIEMIITSGGDNGILFEGTEGRFFVNRGKIVGKPVEDLVDNPLPEGALEEVYGGELTSHMANFVGAIKSRKQPIADVWSHNRMLEICHLSNIAMRLDRELKWDPTKREVIGDDQANSFLSREYRKGFEISM